MEIRAAPEVLEPAAPFAALVFEPLVRLDAAGAPQPCLALSWQHDASAKRWQFQLRQGVKFHDGFLLVPAAVATSLAAAFPGVSISAANDSVIFRADHPMPDLPLALAHGAPVFAHDAEGGFVGTGPFRLAAWEPGRRARFTTYDDYWGARPFLDAVDVQLGRALQDQLVDLELGKTDVAEIGPAELRRGSDRGRTVWASAPDELIALVFTPGHAEDARVREALALALDRAAMHNVLLQKQGEVSAALLPQWLSGYAFAFPATPDVARARTLAAAVPAQMHALALSFEASLPGGRALAERIAVNARDAGITIRVTTDNSQADVRLVEARLPALDAARALAGLATALGLARPSAPNEVPYDDEKKLLEDFRVIPLFHLPDLYGATSRVHVYAPPAIGRLGEWHFENVWLNGGTP